MPHDLIIARYKEDLDWIEGIPDAFDIHLYDKGARELSQSVQRRLKSGTKRENVGREAETYLFHMMTRQKREDGYTVFCQGNPFEHSPDFLDLLAQHEAWQSVQPLSYQWREAEAVPPPFVLSVDPGVRLRGARVRVESYSLLTWDALRFSDWGARNVGTLYRSFYGLDEGVNIAAHCLDQCGLHDMARVAAGHLAGTFCYGGIFAVRNRIINRLSDGEISKMCAVSRTDDIHAWVFEKLWLHLFGVSFLFPADSVQIK